MFDATYVHKFIFNCDERINMIKDVLLFSVYTLNHFCDAYDRYESYASMLNNIGNITDYNLDVIILAGVNIFSYNIHGKLFYRQPRRDLRYE